jgi:hypothetical protein
VDHGEEGAIEMWLRSEREAREGEDESVRGGRDLPTSPSCPPQPSRAVRGPPAADPTARMT